MSEPKILFYDLETIGVNALKADLGAVACFGYKWQGKKAQCLTLEDYVEKPFTKGLSRYYNPETKRYNDLPLLREALEIMSEADLLVAHYGSVFDQRFFAGRCIINSLTPPPPTKMRDTCMIARSRFNFSSNRLVHLGNILQIPKRKEKNEWPGWWFAVLAGDPDALADMAKYCIGDVEALEGVYDKVVPYDLPHPRMVMDRRVCAVCGGHIQYHGYAYIGQHRYRRFQCVLCGKWDRDRKKEVDE